MSEFDVSMRLHRPEEERVKAERQPFEWSKVMTAIQICGAILTIPVGAAGVYAAYRANFSVEVTCQALRTTIITTLEKNVDLDTRRALARRDVAEFERTCATIDPDAKQVFASMMAPKAMAPKAMAPGKVAEPAPVAAVPDAAKPLIKANAAHDPISEAIEREAARVTSAKAPGSVSPASMAPANLAPASVATPLTSPHVRPAPSPKPAEPKPQIVDRTPAAPKADRQTLGEPPAPLGSRLPAEAAAPKPLPVAVTPSATPAVTPKTAALPETSPVSAPDTTVTPMGGPIPPAAPPQLETAQVPGLNAPAYVPPVAAAPRPEPKKSGLNIPFVSDLFGGAPPRPPGEIARDAVPENGPAN